MPKFRADSRHFFHFYDCWTAALTSDNAIGYAEMDIWAYIPRRVIELYLVDMTLPINKSNIFYGLRMDQSFELFAWG